MKKHTNKGIRPEENTKADLFPLRYFNFALENVQKAEESLKVLDYDDGCQYLLVNLDMLITICEKYPTTASMGIYRLNRKQLKETFYEWWERNEKKIPLKYRAGIKETADKLFNELTEIKSWAKSE
ncbi:hypothetical protein J8K84_05715 [Bacteroides fragilis]|jgi:hypothetical protein|uniref:hypothetical protein n=1 Tax=Bacteroides fragilis TaxID=817 RepID=UPI001C72C438|nr:hypothetical protein [Bacteroides fragilis]MCM0250450.1 hypothetical protein [Bacteroides fragilis]MCM0334569.1 hypothetical protein [Bacteroides fragilis]